MSISAEECNFIVEQFRTRFRSIFGSKNAHGLVVGLRNDTAVLRLLVENKIPLSQLPADERMPPYFEYEYGGRRKRLDTAVEEKPKFKAIAQLSQNQERENKARAGEQAWGVDLAGWGTGGWNILLNNVPVCISNWHVFCGLGNATPLNRRVYIGGRDIASLYAFEPVYVGGAINQWDYALARYDDLALVSGSYVPCDDGTVKTYPRRLSESAVLGGTYQKVGARSPTCRTGILTAVGYISVNYEGLGSAVFRQQLIFTQMSTHGDSGSVIVKSDDNTVAGLLFSASEDDAENPETCANPLYANPWVPVGSFVTNDGETIPAFIGDPIVGSASSSVVRGHPFSSFVGKRVVEGQIIAGDDLPGFSAGKLFISAIRGAINCGARTVGFLDPIPAPIRNVPVEVIVGGLDPLGNIDFINGSHRIPVFLLCFG